MRATSRDGIVAGSHQPDEAVLDGPQGRPRPACPRCAPRRAAASRALRRAGVRGIVRQEQFLLEVAELRGTPCAHQEPVGLPHYASTSTRASDGARAAVSKSVRAASCSASLSCSARGPCPGARRRSSSSARAVGPPPRFGICGERAQRCCSRESSAQSQPQPQASRAARWLRAARRQVVARRRREAARRAGASSAARWQCWRPDRR
jgi:hypothetical protein